MSEIMEQKCCIKFCSKNEISAEDTLKLLQNTFGDNCISATRLFEWYNNIFNECREPVEDEERSLLSTAINDNDIQTFKDLVLADERISIRDIVGITGISEDSAKRSLENEVYCISACSKNSGFFAKRISCSDC